MTSQAHLHPHQRSWTRGICLVVCILFSYVNIVHGAVEAGRGFWQERRKAVTQLARLPSINRHALPESITHPQSSVFDLARHQLSPITHKLPVTLPLSYTNFQGAHIPKNWRPSDGLIVYIQDVHMNTEAQKNIGSAVQELIDQGTVDLVALEGGFEEVDLSRFRNFENQDAVRKVADYLLGEHKITGPIHTAFTSKHPIPKIVGVDDEKLYHSHVQAYKDSAPKIKKIKKTLSDQRVKGEAKKSKIFNSSLLDFDKEVQSYRKGDLPIGNYVEIIAQLASKNMHRSSLAIEQFLKALEIEESIDFKKVEQERGSLIEKLASRLSKNKISNLMNVTLAYRVGKMSHTNFYSYLKKLCQSENIKLKNYPAMDLYIQYVIASDRINAEDLLTDVRSMEMAAYKKLIREASEKKIVEESRSLYLTSKLIDFALTPEEWKEYKEAVDGNNNNPLRSFESFFEHASLRDRAVAENLSRAVQEKKAKTVVLVTGGYHTEGITQLLTTPSPINNYSIPAVITLSPKITKLETVKGTEYLSVFTQEKTPLDKLFDGDKLFVGQMPMSRGLRRRIAAYISAYTDIIKHFSHLAWPANVGFSLKKISLRHFELKGPRFSVPFNIHKDRGEFQVEEKQVSFAYRILARLKTLTQKVLKNDSLAGDIATTMFSRGIRSDDIDDFMNHVRTQATDNIDIILFTDFGVLDNSSQVEVLVKAKPLLKAMWQQSNPKLARPITDVSGPLLLWIEGKKAKAYEYFSNTLHGHYITNRFERLFWGMGRFFAFRKSNPNSSVELQRSLDLGSAASLAYWYFQGNAVRAGRDLTGKERKWARWGTVIEVAAVLVFLTLSNGILGAQIGGLAFLASGHYLLIKTVDDHYHLKNELNGFVKRHVQRVFLILFAYVIPIALLHFQFLDVDSTFMGVSLVLYLSALVQLTLDFITIDRGTLWGRSAGEARARLGFMTGEYQWLVNIDANQIGLENSIIGKTGGNLIIDHIIKELLGIAHEIGAHAWRQGGDECMLALPRMTKLQAEMLSKLFMERVRHAVFAAVAIGGEEVSEKAKQIVRKRGHVISAVDKQYILVIRRDLPKKVINHILSVKEKFHSILHRINLIDKTERKIVPSWLKNIKTPLNNKRYYEFNASVSVGLSKSKGRGGYSEVLKESGILREASKNIFKDSGVSQLQVDGDVTADDPLRRQQDHPAILTGQVQGESPPGEKIENVWKLRASSNRWGMLGWGFSGIRVRWEHLKGRVKFYQNLDDFSRHENGIGRMRLENATAFAVVAAKYDFKDETHRYKKNQLDQKARGEEDIRDWRLGNSDFKIVNTVAGDHAGDQVLALLRYEFISQIAFEGMDYYIVMAHGPPSGPIGLIIPKNASVPKLSRDKVKQLFRQHLPIIQKKFNQQSSVQINKLSVLATEIKEEDFATKAGVGHALDRLEQLRVVQEHKNDDSPFIYYENPTDIQEKYKNAQVTKAEDAIKVKIKYQEKWDKNNNLNEATAGGGPTEKSDPTTASIKESWARNLWMDNEKGTQPLKIPDVKIPGVKNKHIYAFYTTVLVNWEGLLFQAPVLGIAILGASWNPLVLFPLLAVSSIFFIDGFVRAHEGRSSEELKTLRWVGLGLMVAMMAPIVLFLLGTPLPFDLVIASKWHSAGYGILANFTFHTLWNTLALMFGWTLASSGGASSPDIVGVKNILEKADGFINQAFQSQNRGNLKDAIALMKKAIYRVKSKNVEYYKNIGYFEEALNKIKTARSMITYWESVLGPQSDPNIQEIFSINEWTSGVKEWVNKNGKTDVPLKLAIDWYSDDISFSGKYGRLVLPLPTAGLRSVILVPSWDPQAGYVIEVFARNLNPDGRKYLIALPDGTWLKPIIEEAKTAGTQGSVGHLLEKFGPVLIETISRNSSVRFRSALRGSRLTNSQKDRLKLDVYLAKLPTSNYRVTATLPAHIQLKEIFFEVDVKSLGTNSPQIFVRDPESRDLLVTVVVDVSDPKKPIVIQKLHDTEKGHQRKSGSLFPWSTSFTYWFAFAVEMLGALYLSSFIPENSLRTPISAAMAIGIGTFFLHIPIWWLFTAQRGAGRWNAGINRVVGEVSIETGMAAFAYLTFGLSSWPIVTFFALRHLYLNNPVSRLWFLTLRNHFSFTRLSKEESAVRTIAWAGQYFLDHKGKSNKTLDGLVKKLLERSELELKLNFFGQTSRGLSSSPFGPNLEIEDLKSYLKHEFGVLHKDLTDDQIIWLTTQVMMRGFEKKQLKEVVQGTEMGEHPLVIAVVPPDVSVLKFVRKILSEHDGKKATFLFQVNNLKSKQAIERSIVGQDIPISVNVVGDLFIQDQVLGVNLVNVVALDESLKIWIKQKWNKEKSYTSISAILPMASMTAFSDLGKDSILNKAYIYIINQSFQAITIPPGLGDFYDKLKQSNIIDKSA